MGIVHIMDILNSWLFVPGNRPERFEKALAAGADAVIIDLEDAVAPETKLAARQAVADFLESGKRAWVRINAAGTEWFEDDLSLLAKPGLNGVILSKAERTGDIAFLMRSGAKTVLPLIESALGHARCRELAACPGVSRLVFGAIDLQADLGMSCTEEELLPLRIELVLASRLAHIAAPVDGVCTDTSNTERLEAETRRARRLGFGGKLCIHPKQVDIVHRSFMPSDAEMHWAQRVIEADAQSGGSVVSLDGQMVDKPVVLRARAILAHMEARRP